MRMARFNPRLIAFGVFAVIFCVAFIRIHVRLQTTLIGYEIGRLKSEESSLLERRSLLKMQLARLTTKQHLSMMTASFDDTTAADEVAAK